MNLTGKIIMNIYSILILIIILYQVSNRDKQLPATHRIYLSLVQVTIILLIIDISSRFDGNYGTIYVILNHVSNFLVFALNLLIPSLWLLYVNYHIFSDSVKNRKLLNWLIGLNVVNLIILIISLPFGWFYYIDSNNMYSRGPYYIFTILITVVMVSSAFVVIYKNKNIIDKKHYFALQFFSVPPIIGMILQTLIFDVPLTLNSLVLSIFLVFINIQKHTLHTDYLTGVGNRKNFEIALANKVQKANRERTFAGIMLDLDDFKSINDEFGHDMGDQALIAAAEVLQNSIRSNDILARLGGDEFFIILDITKKERLKLVIDRIQESLEEFNESSGMPYRLQFSIGYDIYDYKSKMTSEKFRKHVDALMYKNKKKDKKKLDAYSSILIN